MTLLIFTYNCTVKKLMYFYNVYKYSNKSGQSIEHVRYKWLFIIYIPRVKILLLLKLTMKDFENLANDGQNL
jgi:hypothetical protein